MRCKPMRECMYKVNVETFAHRADESNKTRIVFLHTTICNGKVSSLCRCHCMAYYGGRINRNGNVRQSFRLACALMCPVIFSMHPYRTVLPT